MKKWQLYEAKNKLSQLIDGAEHGEAQCITRRGHESVIVISMSEYLKLKRKKKSFKEFLLSAPKIDDVDFSRPKSKTREVDL